jgi:GAF domain-containing protein
MTTPTPIAVAEVGATRRAWSGRLRGWKRRYGDWQAPLLSQALAEREPAGAVAALACVLAVVALFAIEITTPKYESVFTVSAFPVVVAAWLLSARYLFAVAVATCALQLTLGVIGEVRWLTAASGTAALLTLAVIGRVAAVNSAAIRSNRERELKLLLEIANALNASIERPKVMAEVVRAAAAFVAHGELGVKARATIYEVQDGIAHAIAEHDDLGFSLQGHTFEFPPSVMKLLEGSRADTIPVATLAPPLRDLYIDAGVGRIAIAPIRVAGAQFGFVTASARDDKEFNRTELRLLEGIADLAGIGLSNSNVLAAERSRAHTFQALYEVSLAVAGALSPKDLAEFIAERCCAMVSADFGALFWQESEGDTLRVLGDSPPGAFGKRGFRHSEGAVGRAFRQKEPVVVHRSKSRLDAADASLLDAAESLLTVPLLVRDEAVGVLAMISRQRRFTADDARLVALMAAQVAPALDAVELSSDKTESEQRFHALCAALGCGVLVHNAAGELVDYNVAALDILGLGAAEIDSKPPFGTGWTVALANGDKLPPSLRPPSALLNFDQRLHDVVARVSTRGGKPRWLRINCDKVQEHGRVRWVVTTFTEASPPTRRP